MALENEKKPFEVNEKEEAKDTGDIEADTITDQIEEEVNKREEEAEEAKEQIEQEEIEEIQEEKKPKSKIFKYGLAAAGLIAIGFAAWSMIRGSNKEEKEETKTDDPQPISKENSDFLAFGG